MKPIAPTSIFIIAGAVLISCATPRANRSEPSATSPEATITHDEPLAEGTPSAEPNPTATFSVPDIRASCPLEVGRQIACKDEYVPMIVDLRIKLDFPAGTAERGKDEAGRDEILAMAMEEYREHYSVEKIPAICERRQAMAERMPAKVLNDLAAMGPDCHSKKDCQAFTRCVAPIVERIFAMQAEAAAR